MEPARGLLEAGPGLETERSVCAFCGRDNDNYTKETVGEDEAGGVVLLKKLREAATTMYTTTFIGMLYMGFVYVSVMKTGVWCLCL